MTTRENTLNILSIEWIRHNNDRRKAEEEKRQAAKLEDISFTEYELLNQKWHDAITSLKAITDAAAALGYTAQEFGQAIENYLQAQQ